MSWSARAGLSGKVPLHLDWSLFMLLGAGVDVVWLFLGTNEKTPDSFQKRSRQQTKVTTYPQDQLNESGSIRRLLEACP